MYTIYTNDNKEAKLVIHLNSIPLLRVPAVVLAGIGSVKTRYKNWLKKAVNENQELLHILCRIHLESARTESVALLTVPQFKHFHGVVLKEYLEENRDFLTTATPYVFPTEEMPESIKKMTPVDLEEEDDVDLPLSNRKIQQSSTFGSFSPTKGGSFGEMKQIQKGTTPGKSTQVSLEDLAGIIGEDGAKQIIDQIEKDQAAGNTEAL